MPFASGKLSNLRPKYSMKLHDKPLIQLSVRTNPEADDAVSDMLERVTGKSPSTWSNDEDWVSVVTVYSHCSTAAARLWKTGIREGLRRIAACGLDVEPAVIRVRTVRMQDWAESWKRHFAPSILTEFSWCNRRGAGEGHAGISKSCSLIPV